MKITKIDLLLCDPVEDGWRPPMCRVYTDEGIYGDGEAGVQIHVCGSPLLTSASLHIECAIPNFVIHEYNVNTVMPKMLSLAKYDPQPVDGYFTVPELPGIGHEISDYAFSHSQRKTIE